VTRIRRNGMGDTVATQLPLVKTRSPTCWLMGRVFDPPPFRM